MHCSRNSLQLAAGILLASVACSLGQTATATTDPVGFVTLAIPGTTGGATSALSFKGLGLTRPVEYQGSAESIGTNTLVDNDATWTDNQFNGANGAYYVELTSGPGAGAILDVSTTAAGTKTITLAQNLPSGITAPVAFKIRKHWTIATVFGAANEAGLQGGADSSLADNVLIYNGTGYDIYFYQQSFLGTGWRNAANSSVDAGPVKIYPDDGLIIKRQQASPVNVVLMGAVKTGQTSIPIFPGNNIVANPYAAPMTLGSSLLYTGNSSTGIAGGADASTADNVLIYNGTGYDVYFYQQSFLGNGWRNAANSATDASSTSIPVGSSVVVKRAGGSGFDWKAPQHPATL